MFSLSRWWTRSRRSKRGYQPSLELLESRNLLATITVLNNQDSGAGSLRDAVAAAASGDTINFAPGGLVGGQTITLASGNLVPTRNVTITGAGAPAVSIVSASSRIFDFPLSSPDTLTAVTLQNLTLTGTAHDGTTGGAIHIATPNTFFTLTIESCNITGSLAGAGAATRGGAISVTGLKDSLIVANCVIMGTVTTVNTVSNNDAGALYVATTQTVSVTNSTLSGSVTGSTTVNEGGAVYQNSGTLSLTNCTITGSSATKGGGFYQQGGTATLTNCTISGNTVTGNGGGVYVGKGTLNAVNCTITGNTAGGKGGGIAAWFHASNGTGGTSVTNLTNCTISGNTAAAAAGMYLGYIKPTTGINPTGKNTVTANNTILTGSIVRQTSGTATNTNLVFNASNSLFDTTPTTGAGNTINGTNANNLFGANPMLGPLQNNGGPTHTLALPVGSPAIDAGNNTLANSLTTDQRGLARFVNGTADIGAYEYQPAATVTLTSSLNPAPLGQSVTFTAILSLVPGSNTPTGSVTFLVDGVSQGSVPLGGLTATFATSSMTVGGHTILAVYNTAPFSQSQSAPLTQTISAASGIIATGTDVGGVPEVKVFDTATGALLHDFLAYDPSFLGGVRVAVGDVNHDGTPDIITAPGPGGGPLVKVFSGTDLFLLLSFNAYDPGFCNGLFVAAADVNGDEKADIVTSPDAGGGPLVKVFSGTDGTLLLSFNAYDPSFRGGVHVAAGDTNGDGFADVITGPGAGGGPLVNVFNGMGGGLLLSFNAYPLVGNFLGGVFVAAGDVNGDGIADILTGPGVGGGPLVNAFNGVNGGQLLGFNAYDPALATGPLEIFDNRHFSSGVRVAAVDVNNDGQADIVTAAGPGAPPEVKVFDRATLAVIDDIFAYESSYLRGVFVAAGR